MMGKIHDAAEDERTDPRYPQGFVPFGYHLVPRLGLARVAATMRAGELKGRAAEDWKEIPVEEHINHAINHLVMYLEGRSEYPHLAHAGCRVLMALDLDQEEKLEIAGIDEVLTPIP
jgi:hypothetical protein